MMDEDKGFGDVTSYDVAEEKKPLIRRGCTAGRIVNALISLNYFLVLLTALIVSCTLAVLNNRLAKHYPDNSINNKTCVFYAHCDDKSSPCDVIYNGSGACEFLEAGFGIIVILAFFYIAACVVRIVLATDIWLVTVIVDIVLNTSMLVMVMIMGIIISIGLAVTCSEVSKHYGGTGNCSGNPIPDINGYKFYREANVSQGAAWFCFLFLFISTAIFIIRSCILCRRRTSVPSGMDGADVLTADDDFKETDDEPTRPV